MIDACATERRTRAFLAAIAGVTDRPVRTLVNTHHHGDHTHGNHLFTGATIVAHDLIARAASVADLAIPPGATAAGRNDSGPEEPFAAALVSPGTVRIIGGGPPPRPRPHLPQRRAADR